MLLNGARCISTPSCCYVGRGGRGWAGVGGGGVGREGGVRASTPSARSTLPLMRRLSAGLEYVRRDTLAVAPRLESGLVSQVLAG